MLKELKWHRLRTALKFFYSIKHLVSTLKIEFVNYVLLFFGFENTLSFMVLTFDTGQDDPYCLREIQLKIKTRGKDLKKKRSL